VYAQIFGAFDFNAMKLVPPGTKAIIHDKPDKRRTWAAHGQIGYFIGPALEHYHCYRIYYPKSRAERIGDTVEFFPEKAKFPITSSVDRAIDAANDFAKALKHPAPESPIQIQNP